MRYSIATLALALAACSSPAASPDSGTQTSATAEAGSVTSDASADASASADPNAPKEFQLGKSTTAGSARGVAESKIKPTPTEAAMKLIVEDKEQKPIPGIVVTLTGPDGKKIYTEETDAMGYTETLVPIGKKYEIVYLSLGQKDFAANVNVTSEPMQNIKLTLRFKKWSAEPGGFVLEGIEFDTGKASIRPDSLPRLDSVIEFMTHKKSARIEIAGHTDNVGSKAANKSLSQKRAESVRDHLVSKGIDKSRIEAKGYGDERPMVPNDSDANRQKNRRIEATEMLAK